VLGLVASAVSLEGGDIGAGAGCAVAISELQPNNATEAALYHGMFNLFILITPGLYGISKPTPGFWQ
jgi:Na+/glutamate symporter